MSLWDEYDNQIASTTGTKHRQTHAPTEQAIVSSTREWLLRDYVSAFCRALAATRLYRRCYWVDAWGIAQKSLQAPPVIQAIVELSKALAQENKPIALNGLLLDSSASGRKGARASQNGAAPKNETLALPGDSGILRASWPESAQALLKEIENVPAVFLLNPCGPTLFTYDDLALLAQRSSAPTELCLLVSHRQIETHIVAAARSAARAAALNALLRTDRWKTLLTREEGVPFHASGVVDLLQASLRQHFRWVQPIALSVQSRPVLVEPAPYTLLFASRHKDGLNSMNDALCAHGRRLYNQSRQGILAEEWFASQQQQRLAGELRQLRQRTLQLGQAQRPRRWPELRQQLLLENFGQFTLRDYDEVICELLLDNKVRCEWRRAAPASTTSQRIPGNDDTLLWR